MIRLTLTTNLLTLYGIVSAALIVQASAQSSIVNRRVFYNNATGANLSSAGSANNATASDKSPLLPGGTSSYSNYTNYFRGINGVIVDIANLPATTTNAEMLASLQFSQWNGIAVSGFAALSGLATPSVTILDGSGAGGAARVKITFPDNTVQNTWLRVTVLANPKTGLAVDDVFYFGNVVGEMNTGNTATRLRVNATDSAAVRVNPTTAMNSAVVTNIYDINRDGRVNATDTALVRNNQQTAGIVAPITAPITDPLAPSP